MKTNQIIKIQETICAPDFDLWPGDEVELIQYNDPNDFVKSIDPTYKLCIVKLIKCDDEPTLIGQTGEFMIDANDNLVSF